MELERYRPREYSPFYIVEPDGTFRGGVDFDRRSMSRGSEAPLEITDKPRFGEERDWDYGGSDRSRRYDDRSDERESFVWTRWSRRQRWAAVAGIVAIGALAWTPSRVALSGVAGSAWNYGTASLRHGALEKSLTVESSVNFQSTANPAETVTGLASYKIDVERIQQDPEKKTNSIGVRISVDDDKLRQVTPNTEQELKVSDKLRSNPLFYTAYVAHFNNERMTAQCNNELNRIAQIAIKKADVLWPTEAERANLANSESAYAIKFGKQKDDPSRYNTYVGLVIDGRTDNADLPACVVNLTAQKP